MALQVALSRLRHHKDEATSKTNATQHTSLQSQKPGAPNLETGATAPLFSVDEAELFSFSDEDIFMDDDHFLFPTSPSKPIATVATVTKTTASVTVNDNIEGTVERENNLSARRQEHSDDLLIKKGTSLQHITTGHHLQRSAVLNSTKFSPCTETVEKLRAFKFVKTSKSDRVNSKRPSDDTQSDLTPPPNKRRPVYNDITNREQNTGKIDATSQWDASADCNGPTFKQPSFNPRTRFTNARPSTHSVQSVGQSSKVTNDPPSTSTNGGISRTDPHCASTQSPMHVSTPTPSSLSTSVTTPVRRFCQPSNSPALLRTPTSGTGPVKHVAGSNVTTPITASSQSRFSTPQRSKYTMRTPTRGRQATPLVCTPTGSGMTTPISRSAAATIKRKFPGPAGLLPSLVPGQRMDNLYIPPPSTPTPASTPKQQRLKHSAPAILPSSDLPAVVSQCAPEDDAIFTQRPWTDMLSDLDLNDSQSSTLLQYNIATSLKQAASKQLNNGKVVHLRAVIKSIIPAGKNASALIKDPTGEAMCSIHSKVVEDYQKDLQPGSVLILRQVSVFSPSPRKHYFNITPSNIVRVYPPHAESSSEHQPRPPLSISDMIAEDSEDTESELTQCTPSGRDLNHSSLGAQCSSSSSQTRQAHNYNRPLVLNGSTFHGKATAPCRLNYLSKGATSVLAACKVNSLSSDVCDRSQTTGEGTVAVNLASGDSNNCDEYLFDNLPSDFNDFSDDNIVAADEGVLVSGGEGDNPIVNASCTDRGSFVMNDEKRHAPKESNFFSKLCEDEFDTLFNDVSDDSLDF